MASAFPSAVTVVQVGNFFVGQYYQVLQQQPELVHQFYTDASRVTRIDGQAVETADAMLQIHSLIMSLNFTSIEIKTAHSMESWNGGVLVMVSGSVQIEEFNSRRKFAQTFFLAPQEKGYFVLNDIFQFFDEEQHLQHPSAVIDHGNYDSNLNVSSYDSNVNILPYDSSINVSSYDPNINVSSFEPNLNVPSYDSNLDVPSASEPVHTDFGVESYAVKDAVQDDEYVPAVHSQESEAIDTYTIPEPASEIPEVETRLEEEDKAEEPTPSYPSSYIVNTRDLPSTPAEEPHEEPVKHTYASILRSKGHFVASVSQPSLPKINAVVSEWDQPVQQPPQPAPVQHYSQQPIVSEKSNPEAADEISAFEDEGEVTSVYVRNLPSSASVTELEQEFRNFGRLKPEGVLIKSRKEAGVYYAFVEFEDISGVQNAVKASPIPYKGRQIYVEERRANSIAARGRRGRGRSSYQYESTRGGRGYGARTYGRGIGQDNSARDYSSRARGNGFHQRTVPRQERGILGSQGARNGQNQYDTSY